MSGARGRMRKTRAGHALVALYPEAWRARYGEELHALIDDDPPGAREVLSLLAGAADAHLRPLEGLRSATPPAHRMRGSISGAFACWVALSLAGAAFQKETEDPPFGAAERHHALLGAAHAAVVAGAALGAGVIALAGVPLLWRALRQALAQRDLPLALAIGLAPAAIACFAALTGVVAALSRPGPVSPSGEAKPGVLIPWALAGLLCALACALAPRLALGRLAAPGRPLVRAAGAGAPALALAMVLVSAGMIVYAVSLALISPALWSESTGPGYATTSTGLALALAAALAALSTGLGALAAVRARHAAAERT